MKKVLLVTLSTLVILSLTGCGKKVEKKDENKGEIKEETKDNNIVDEEDLDFEKLEIKNPGIKLGEDTYNVKINNKDKVIKIEYNNYPKSKLDQDDVENYRYYYTYTIYLDDTKIGSFEKYVYESYEDIRNLANATESFNLKPFNDDVKTTLIKDKYNNDYLVLNIPVYTESSTNEEMFITNENGKLLGTLYVDNNMGFTITGDGSSNYYRNEENTELHYSNYYFINNNGIYYIYPEKSMFVKEDNGYIGLNYELEEITVEEYLVSIENGKLVNNKTGRTYKIANLEGGDSSFSEFKAN